ncbi:MAG: hypothetical protein V1810_01755 [Candidatus Beckwithbacteria bacterium]
MKKISYLTLLTIFSLSLTGCVLKKPDETKTVGEPETAAPVISDNNSLGTIESELDNTLINDFDADFKAIDGDINQL